VISLQSKNKTKGFTLLEVLVAMVLLSIGLLGVARLQMFGLQNTGNAYFRTQASGLLTELVERVRANPNGALDRSYNLAIPACISGPVPAPLDCVAASCTAAQLAQFDLYAVNCGLNGTNDGSGVDELLPSGAMTIACSNPPNPAATTCLQYTVTVTWSETNDDDKDGAADTNTISMTFTP